MKLNKLDMSYFKCIYLPDYMYYRDQTTWKQIAIENIELNRRKVLADHKQLLNKTVFHSSQVKFTSTITSNLVAYFDYNHLIKLLCSLCNAMQWCCHALTS